MAAQKSADDAAAASSQAAGAAKSAAAVAAASSSASNTLHAPGETVDDGSSRKVTFYSLQRPAARSAPAPESAGTEWVAADVKVCYGPGARTTDSNSSWVLIDQNNGNYQPSSTGYSQFPSPQYPFGDMTVADGQCVRGWIVYPVTIGSPIVNVAYMPTGGTSPIRWHP